MLINWGHPMFTGFQIQEISDNDYVALLQEGWERFNPIHIDPITHQSRVKLPDNDHFYYCFAIRCRPSHRLYGNDRVQMMRKQKHLHAIISENTSLHLLSPSEETQQPHL